MAVALFALPCRIPSHPPQHGHPQAQELQASQVHALPRHPGAVYKVFSLQGQVRQIIQHTRLRLSQ